MDFTKTTEQDSNYNHLEKMTINELLTNINKEDKTVPFAVEKVIPQIEKLVNQIVKKLKIRWTIILYWCWNKWPIRNCRCFRMSSNLWSSS